MFYARERDLQEELSHISFDFYDSHPVSFSRREFRVGGCIPDLVSIHFTHDPSSFNWPSKWSYRHSYFVWLLKEQEKLTLEQTASLTFTPVKKTRVILDELCKSGVVTKDSQDVFSVASYMKKFDAEVIAIEAKLRKWRDALSQAIRYKDFANIVFVAMDADTVPRYHNILDKFEAEQVGLCAVYPGGMIEWLVSPGERQHGIGHEKEYLVMSASIPATQKFWARRNDRSAFSQA
jgi:hypothetical protein